MRHTTPKPIRRSKLRLKLGSIYFSAKRRFWWRFSGTQFASRRAEQLPYPHMTHETPLLRKLKDVQMYLQYNKIINLRIAAAKLSGVTLRPGETFSYWKLIGRPTKAKGYLPGMILENGTYKAGTGGGLCQLSNLIYWMTIHTPLTVLERYRHSFDVFPDADRTQPFGSGATCYYNYLDLMLQNHTAATYQLVLEVTDTHLKGCWLSDVPLERRYEVYEKKHYIQPEYWGGYTRHNAIFRRIYDLDGQLLDDEFVVENHALMMYEPMLAEHKPQP